MTSFDDKEKAAENKYARDKELEFKVHARGHKLFGLWAAGKLGLLGEEAEIYATSIVHIHLETHSHKDMLEKIKADLLEKSLKFSDHDLQTELNKAEVLAKKQIQG